MLTLLDMLTECRFVGIVTRSEFAQGRDFWTPPEETMLGRLWNRLLEKGVIGECVGPVTWLLHWTGRKKKALDAVAKRMAR